MGQTLNNFTIIKLITIIIVYTSPLRKKKKSLLFFFTLTPTTYLSQKAAILFLLFFHYTAPMFFSPCGTSFFFLFVFCSLAHHTHAFYIFSSATSHSQEHMECWLSTCLLIQVEIEVLISWAQLIKELHVGWTLVPACS